MKMSACLLLPLVLAVTACDSGARQRITIEFTAPGGSAQDFTGRFGKHEHWESVEGTTPKEFVFDLTHWGQPCLCFHRLVARKTSAGADTLRVRTFCQGAVVSDTFTTTQDSLDYAPTAP